MAPDTLIATFTQGIHLMILFLLVLIIPGLLVGVVVAMFQAATQINEMSLSFVPKLIATFIVMMMAGPWLMKMMVEYTQDIFANIPYYLG